MTARILVVDDIAANAKLLEARLTAEYFDVVTATSGVTALEICARESFDLVLLDVMMPGLDGFETCRRMKADPVTAHIPVVIVTALDQPADRVKGLDAGADDFLTKPLDEVALLARVRSLTRLKMILDELRQRAMTSASLGLSETFDAAMSEPSPNGRVLLVDDRQSSSERIVSTISRQHVVDVSTDIQDALFKGAEGGYDLLIISLALTGYDPLRLCGQIRSLERTRQLPILLIADLEDKARVLRGLDIGVNDYLTRPVDRNELLARVRTQIRRKRYSDRLRETLQASIELAIVDQLTGLHNRRYLESHLPPLVQTAAGRGRSLSIMILDIDHFKAVNDTYGHDAGDEILKAFALRVKQLIRNSDLLCRLGGEEFIVVMPDTTSTVAATIAERIRQAISAAPFPIETGCQMLSITVSIGISERSRDTNAGTIMKRADQALYQSKSLGRNRVTADAA